MMHARKVLGIGIHIAFNHLMHQLESTSQWWVYFVLMFKLMERSIVYFEIQLGLIPVYLSRLGVHAPGNVQKPPFLISTLSNSFPLR